MASRIEQCKTCGDKYCCHGTCIDKLKQLLRTQIVIDVNKNGIRREKRVCRKR